MSSDSYRKTLKSTSVIGGASLINILIGMVKTKVVAVLLGPAGIGLVGVYNSIIGMVSTVAGMGIGTGGTMQIAKAHGSGDPDRVARTVKTVRRTVWVTGALGMSIMVMGCTLFSKASFGTGNYAAAIALLGITVLLANIAAGQSCILQGTRRISDLARVSIVGALNGTVISVPCYYFWGIRGIVPGLILTGAAALATSWWFASRVPLVSVSVQWSESCREAGKLFKFGVPLMLSGLMGALSAYFLRALLVRQIGLTGVGIWQAAFNLSSILVNFVLAAMGTDYCPRLAAVADDNQRVSAEVNAQTEIALMLAVPGLAATIIFAPLAIKLFYSGNFDAAVDILRWSVYGVLGRVISWPLGFVLLAKGMGKTFFATELFASVFQVVALWGCVKMWGLPGTGIAFLLLYAAYALLIYIVARAVSGVSWTSSNRWHIAVFTGLLACIGLVSSVVTNLRVQFPFNLLLLAALCIYCLRRLSLKSGITLPGLLQKLRMKNQAP